jgi:rhodanese-related sulfurtransferase
VTQDKVVFMRVKILLVWFLLLPWAGMSCGQGPSGFPPDDGGLSDGGDEANPVCLSGELPALGGLSPEELHAALADKDFLLINVASASGGQIAGTDAYVPYDDPDALVDYIGPDLKERVVLYCVSSGRSGVAGRSLVERDYCSIRHLLGGMNAWTAAGFPLE